MHLKKNSHNHVCSRFYYLVSISYFIGSNTWHTSLCLVIGISSSSKHLIIQINVPLAFNIDWTSIKLCKQTLDACLALNNLYDNWINQLETSRSVPLIALLKCQYLSRHYLMLNTSPGTTWSSVPLLVLLEVQYLSRH